MRKTMLRSLAVGALATGVGLGVSGPAFAGGSSDKGKERDRAPKSCQWEKKKADQAKRKVDRAKSPKAKKRAEYAKKQADDALEACMGKGDKSMKAIKTNSNGDANGNGAVNGTTETLPTAQVPAGVTPTPSSLDDIPRLGVGQSPEGGGLTLVISSDTGGASTGVNTPTTGTNIVIGETRTLVARNFAYPGVDGNYYYYDYWLDTIGNSLLCVPGSSGIPAQDTCWIFPRP